MAVVKINDLKARFSTGDAPTAKDFADLIDTVLSGQDIEIPDHSISLAAFAADVGNPSMLIGTDGSGNFVYVTEAEMGAAPGPDIVGDFPNIHVASDPEDNNQRGITADHVKDFVLPLQKIFVPPLTSFGAVPTHVGSGILNWLVPTGGGGGGGGSVGTGSIRKVITPPQNLVSINDSSYTQVLIIAHNLGVAPDDVRVVLRCVANEIGSGHVVGDEVDADSVFSNRSGSLGPAFSVEADNTNVQVIVRYQTFSGGDTSPALQFPVKADTSGAFTTIEMPFSSWQLVTYVEAFVNGSGIANILEWTSPDETFDLASALAISVANPNNTIPVSYNVYLKCISNDGGFTVGQYLPLDMFENHLAGEKLFTTAVSSTTFNVNVILVAGGTNSLNTISPNNATPPVNTNTLDHTKWVISVKAVFNASSSGGTGGGNSNCVQLHGVKAATLLSGELYTYNWVTGNAGQTIFTSNIMAVDLATGGIDFKQINIDNTFGTLPAYAQMSLVKFPTAAAHKIMLARGPGNGSPGLLCSYNITSGTPTFTAEGSTAVASSLAAELLSIVQVDDSGSTPIFYFIQGQNSGAGGSSLAFATLGACSVGTLTKSGSTWTPTGVKVVSFFNGGISNISALTALYTNGTSAANIVMARYNPVKGLFYLVDMSSGLMHVFRLTATGSAATNFPTWIGSAIDYTKLAYVSSFLLSVGQKNISNASAGYSWNLNIDPETGVELSFTIADPNNNSVIVVPWTFNLS